MHPPLGHSQPAQPWVGGGRDSARPGGGRAPTQAEAGCLRGPLPPCLHPEPSSLQECPREARDSLHAGPSQISRPIFVLPLHLRPSQSGVGAGRGQSKGSSGPAGV